MNSFFRSRRRQNQFPRWKFSLYQLVCHQILVFHLSTGRRRTTVSFETNLPFGRQNKPVVKQNNSMQAAQRAGKRANLNHFPLFFSRMLLEICSETMKTYRNIERTFDIVRNMSLQLRFKNQAGVSSAQFLTKVNEFFICR